MIMGFDDWRVLGSMSICRESVSTDSRDGDIGMMMKLTCASAEALLPAEEGWTQYWRGDLGIVWESALQWVLAGWS